MTCGIKLHAKYNHKRRLPRLSYKYMRKIKENGKCMIVQNQANSRQPHLKKKKGVNYQHTYEETIMIRIESANIILEER